MKNLVEVQVSFAKNQTDQTQSNLPATFDPLNMFFGHCCYKIVFFIKMAIMPLNFNYKFEITINKMFVKY